MGGTYTGQFPFLLTSADAGQSWLGYPGQTPILEGNRSAERAIDITGSNITIRWLTIQNFTTDGIRAGGVSNTTIDSNRLLNIDSYEWDQAAININDANSGPMPNTTVSHNYISGAGYAGIGCWFGPGHDYSNLKIVYNEVYNTGKSVPDGGAIYCWTNNQLSPGALIANNIVGNYGNTRPIEVVSDPRWTRYSTKWNTTAGIYLDNAMRGVTVRNNIIYGVGHWPIFSSGGDSDQWQNNILDITDSAYIGAYKSQQSAGPSSTFTCNIVYSSSSTSSSRWFVNGNVADLNIASNNYWSAVGTLSSVTDSAPVRADPRFANAAGHNYRFQGGSPMPCFQPIDTSTVGPLPN